MTTLFLVDNSVIQRLAKPAVAAAWLNLRERGEIATCLPTLLEAGYSARSGRDHHKLVDLEQRSKIVLPPTPEVTTIALRLQTALFDAGKGRSVGVSDLQIAATALHYSTPDQPVVVVHYDSDFEHLSSIDPVFQAEWIVPSGTAD